MELLLSILLQIELDVTCAASFLWGRIKHKTGNIFTGSSKLTHLTKA
jgi:hypothetical protein